MSCRHTFLVFSPKIIIIYIPVNPTLFCIKLEPTGVLFARTCEGDVSKVNIPALKTLGFLNLTSLMSSSSSNKTDENSSHD